MLLQLFLGERCDCARQATTSWFKHFKMDDFTGWPEVEIPKVNGKTCPRKIPLNPQFAHLLWGWMVKEPLASDCRCWPVEGQNLNIAIEKETDQYLFCGFTGFGLNDPVFKQPVSERAFFKQLQRAVEILKHERQVAHHRQQSHVFDDVDLSLIGTHSWKKTAVTLMKEQKVSTSVISAITGTSVRILDEVYDVPTQRRQRHMVKQVFGPVVGNILKTGDSLSCPNCLSSVEPGWKFCPHCAEALPASETAKLVSRQQR